MNEACLEHHQIFTNSIATFIMKRRWYNGQHSCLPSSWSGFDSRPTQSILVFLEGCNVFGRKKVFVRSGIRTHALRRGLRPERSALDHSAILTWWQSIWSKKLELLEEQPDSYLVLELVTQNQNRFAPGEARTHGLQIMRLTRCLLRYGGLDGNILCWSLLIFCDFWQTLSGYFHLVCPAPNQVSFKD